MLVEMRSERFLVYGLVDPRDRELKYVGKSCSGLRRPKQHFYTSFLKQKSKKNSWIKSLKSLGLLPEIRVLAVCADAPEAAICETRVISHLRPSMNMTEGGTGGNTGGSHKKWIPVVSRNLLTGEERFYRYVHETAKDGFVPTKVVACCRGRCYSHHAHTFRYMSALGFQSGIWRISVITKSTGEVRTFENAPHAAHVLGVCKETINNWIRGRNQSKLFLVSRITDTKR